MEMWLRWEVRIRLLDRWSHAKANERNEHDDFVCIVSDRNIAFDFFSDFPAYFQFVLEVFSARNKIVLPNPHDESWACLDIYPHTIHQRFLIDDLASSVEPSVRHWGQGRSFKL